MTVRELISVLEGVPDQDTEVRLEFANNLFRKIKVEALEEQRNRLPRYWKEYGLTGPGYVVIKCDK